MISVSDYTKQLFMQDNSHKRIRVFFRDIGLYYLNENIVNESLKLTESILDREDVEFIGCISSCLQITLFNVPNSVKGERVEVFVQVNNQPEIKLFTGVVDSVVMQSDRNFKKITAYDSLYEASQKDVAEWYDNLSFPITLGTLRQSLCNYIGLAQASQTLPNDGLSLTRQFENSQMPAIDVLKSICQINGAFGVVNRDGLFEYRYIREPQYMAYPSSPIAYPGLLYPATLGSTTGAYEVDFYESLEFEEYTVQPVDKIQIRDNENDVGIEVGTGTNKYIIQANMFAYGLEDATKISLANNILAELDNVTFRPCKIKNYGLPFIEVGDVLQYYVPSKGQLMNFVVMDREISGIQLLRDTYTARGNEEQSEFITDVQAQLDAIKMGGGGGDMSDYYTKEEVDQQISDMETPTGFNVESVVALPATQNAATLYLISSDIYVW